MRKIITTIAILGATLVMSGCNSHAPTPKTTTEIRGDNVKQAIVILIDKVEKLEASITKEASESKINAENEEMLLLKNNINTQNEQIENQYKHLTSLQDKLNEITGKNTTINTGVTVVEPTEYDRIIKDFANTDSDK